jgi:hypothetical protein
MAKKFLVLIALLTCLLCVHASAVSLEQVQPVMPDISVFVHSDGQDFSSLKPEDISATLDGKALKVGDFAVSDEGIYYVFMLDISKSIKQDYLDAAKQAVLNTYKQLRPQDQLAVITFGDKVTVLLDGSESADVVSQKTAAIKCTDNNTRLYDAMATLVKTASAKADMRHVAVIVSDGVESSDEDITQEQLEQNLREGGVAVYALAVDTASDADTANFRNFVKVSGGELFVFSPSSAQQTLTSMLKQIDEIWAVKLTADSNIADGKQHDLEIKFGGFGTVSTQIAPTKWVPDDTPPYILSLDTDETAGTIKVVFSEAMEKLDDLTCYKLQAPSGTTAPALSLSSAEADSVTLAASGISKADGWQLAFSGLTDASMEKNAMPACAVPLSGVAAAVSTATDAVSATDAAAEAAGSVVSPIIIVIIVAAVAIAAVIGAVFYLKKHGGLKLGSAKSAGGSKVLKKHKKTEETPHFVFQNTDGKKPDDRDGK